MRVKSSPEYLRWIITLSSANMMSLPSARELGEHLVDRAKAHGRAVGGRDAAELARVRAAAHRLHDLKRDVLLRAEEVAPRDRAAGEESAAARGRCA